MSADRRRPAHEHEIATVLRAAWKEGAGPVQQPMQLSYDRFQMPTSLATGQAPHSPQTLADRHTSSLPDQRPHSALCLSYFLTHIFE